MKFDTLPDDVLDHILAFMPFSAMTLHMRHLNRRFRQRATTTLSHRHGKGLKFFTGFAEMTRVELAMPSAVKAMTFDLETHRLYVCTTGDAPTECVLYEHLPLEIPQSQSWVFTDQHKGRLMQILSLSTEKIEYFQFEGPFLVCRSRNEECLIFDCRNRMKIELPMGYTNFFSSSTGRRIAALSDDTIVVFLSPLFEASQAEGETNSLTSSTAYENYRNMQSLSSLPASPTSECTQEVDEESVTLIPAFKTQLSNTVKHVITDAYLISVSVGGAGWFIRWLNCNVAEALDKYEIHERIVDSQLEVGSLQTVGDSTCVVIDSFLRKIIIYDVRMGSLRVIECMKTSSFRCLRVNMINMGHSKAAIDKILCCSGINGYKNQLLLVSMDGTCVRKLETQHVSLTACHPTEPMLMTASDADCLSEHPLLQALEGGYGSLIQFSENTNTSQSTKGISQHSTHSDRLSIVIISCYAAVSLALVWTTFALFYNGWWLYMQSLFVSDIVN